MTVHSFTFQCSVTEGKTVCDFILHATGFCVYVSAVTCCHFFFPFPRISLNWRFMCKILLGRAFGINTCELENLVCKGISEKTSKMLGAQQNCPELEQGDQALTPHISQALDVGCPQERV